MPDPMQGNPSGAAEQGSDNHLRLNPNDPQWQEGVANWEDGDTVRFREIEAVQISPGEYRVTKATPVPAAPPDQGAAAGGSEGTNSAMGSLMAEQEA
jgi:hypothetical protein